MVPGSGGHQGPGEEGPLFSVFLLMEREVEALAGLLTVDTVASESATSSRWITPTREDSRQIR